MNFKHGTGKTLAWVVMNISGVGTAECCGIVIKTGFSGGVTSCLVSDICNLLHSRIYGSARILKYGRLGHTANPS